MRDGIHHMQRWVFFVDLIEVKYLTHDILTFLCTLCTFQHQGMNKQELMKDARQMGKVLTIARQKGIAVPQDILAREVGLEHLTSAKKMRRVFEYRKHHATQVLARQHVCTPEELGEFSSASSEVARSRAGALAAAYWKMQS